MAKTNNENVIEIKIFAPAFIGMMAGIMAAVELDCSLFSATSVGFKTCIGAVVGSLAAIGLDQTKPLNYNVSQGVRFTGLALGTYLAYCAAIQDIKEVTQPKTPPPKIISVDQKQNNYVLNDYAEETYLFPTKRVSHAGFNLLG